MDIDEIERVTEIQPIALPVPEVISLPIEEPILESAPPGPGG